MTTVINRLKLNGIYICMTEIKLGANRRACGLWESGLGWAGLGASAVMCTHFASSR
jgi:hypothetical protein